MHGFCGWNSSHSHGSGQYPNDGMSNCTNPVTLVTTKLPITSSTIVAVKIGLVMISVLVSTRRFRSNSGLVGGKYITISLLMSGKLPIRVNVRPTESLRMRVYGICIVNCTLEKLGRDGIGVIMVG